MSEWREQYCRYRLLKHWLAGAAAGRAAENVSVGKAAVTAAATGNSPPPFVRTRSDLDLQSVQEDEEDEEEKAPEAVERDLLQRPPIHAPQPAPAAPPPPVLASPSNVAPNHRSTRSGGHFDDGAAQLPASPSAASLQQSPTPSLSPSPSPEAPLLFLAHRAEHLSHLRNFSKPPTLSAQQAQALTQNQAEARPKAPSESAFLVSGVAASTPHGSDLQQFLQVLQEDFARVQAFYAAQETVLQTRFERILARLSDQQHKAMVAAGPVAPSPPPTVAVAATVHGTNSKEQNGNEMELADFRATAPASNASTLRRRSLGSTDQDEADARGAADSVPAAKPAVVPTRLLARKTPEGTELIELYHAALLLDNFRLLNGTAFLKIAQHFDELVAREMAAQVKGTTTAATGGRMSVTTRFSVVTRDRQESFGPATRSRGSVISRPPEGLPFQPLLDQVEDRLASADNCFTSTRLESLMEAMLSAYARAFVGVNGRALPVSPNFTPATVVASDEEALALDEARRILSFPLPRLARPEVKEAKIMAALLAVLVVIVLGLSLGVESLEADIRSAISGSAVKSQLCFGIALEKGKCAADAAFPWSITSQLPIYRGIGLFLLHILLWSICVRALRFNRVNYTFLLDLDSSTVTRPLRISVLIMRLFTVFLLFLIWQLSAWVHQGRRLLNLLSPMPPVAEALQHLTSSSVGWAVNAPSVCMVLFFIGVLFYPGDGMLLSGRRWLLRTTIAGLSTPFLPLRFSHTWVINQFSTVSRALTDTSYTLCFLTFGMSAEPAAMSLHGAQRCTKDIEIYWWWIALFPTWIRLVQSIRRYFLQDANPRHLWNGLKYGQRVVIGLLAATRAMAPSVAQKDQSTGAAFIYWTWLALSYSNILYSTYWDLTMDWGFTQPKVKLQPAALPDVTATTNEQELQPTLWARLTPTRIRFSCARALLLPPTWSWIYLFSITFDPLCRLLSLTSRYPFDGIYDDSGFNNFGKVTMLAVLESIRRNWINFHRLEHEHLTNAEKFREMTRIPALTPADYADDTKQQPKKEAELAEVVTTPDFTSLQPSPLHTSSPIHKASIEMTNYGQDRAPSVDALHVTVSLQ